MHSIDRQIETAHPKENASANSDTAGFPFLED